MIPFFIGLRNFCWIIAALAGWQQLGWGVALLAGLAWAALGPLYYLALTWQMGRQARSAGLSSEEVRASMWRDMPRRAYLIQAALGPAIGLAVYILFSFLPR